MATARRLVRLMTTAATLQHHGSYAQTGMRIVLWQSGGQGIAKRTLDSPAFAKAGTRTH
jgi:hypothetical protein